MAHFAQGGENGDYNPYKGAGFFATPMSVCKMMVNIAFMGQGDCRGRTFNDPCCGTGSILLAASNHTMRLSAQDISRSMVLCTKLNMYLYAPWAVWWPDFARYGGPTRAQLEAAIFGAAEPVEPPILVQMPMFAPVARVMDDLAVRAMIRERLERRAGLAA